jgi:FlaA1/EpsC-like NDP-sugar epimerase
MEENPRKRYYTNLADLSCLIMWKKFVMVSTDKAVNPSNVMGASKRIAENMFSLCIYKARIILMIIARSSLQHVLETF